MYYIIILKVDLLFTNVNAPSPSNIIKCPAHKYVCPCLSTMIDCLLMSQYRTIAIQ